MPKPITEAFQLKLLMKVSSELPTLSFSSTETSYKFISTPSNSIPKISILKQKPKTWWLRTLIPKLSVEWAVRRNWVWPVSPSLSLSLSISLLNFLCGCGTLGDATCIGETGDKSTNNTLTVLLNLEIKIGNQPLLPFSGMLLEACILKKGKINITSNFLCMFSWQRICRKNNFF